LKLAANGLQHVFEKWVERCKKRIYCQGRYFEKETVTAPPQSSDSSNKVSPRTFQTALVLSMPRLASANDANIDIACSLHSFIMKSYRYGILNAVCKSRIGVRLGNYQWCGELCFSGAATSKDSCPPRILMQGRHRLNKCFAED
jgi:hypothetical protein